MNSIYKCLPLYILLFCSFSTTVFSCEPFTISTKLGDFIHSVQQGCESDGEKYLDHSINAYGVRLDVVSNPDTPYEGHDMVELKKGLQRIIDRGLSLSQLQFIENVVLVQLKKGNIERAEKLFISTYKR